MNRAFARSGLADQFCNTHVLRRSIATRLQRAGVSIKEIADLLRHRGLTQPVSTLVSTWNACAASHCRGLGANHEQLRDLGSSGGDLSRLSTLPPVARQVRFHET
jgi:hypothetical protein